MKKHIRFNASTQRWEVVYNGVVISESSTFLEAQKIYNRKRKK